MWRHMVWHLPNIRTNLLLPCSGRNTKAIFGKIGSHITKGRPWLWLRANPLAHEREQISEKKKNKKVVLHQIIVGHTNDFCLFNVSLNIIILPSTSRYSKLSLSSPLLNQSHVLLCSAPYVQLFSPPTHLLAAPVVFLMNKYHVYPHYSVQYPRTGQWDVQLHLR